MRTCNASVEDKHANPEIYSTGSMPLKHITILPYLPTPMHKTAKHKGKPTITPLKMILIYNVFFSVSTNPADLSM